MDLWDKILKKRQLADFSSNDSAQFPILSLLGTIKQITFFSMIGLLNLSVVYFIDDKWLFLFILCIGCTILFATTTGINLLVMLSVPEQHRGFAVALNSVIIHAFGDVPSPVIAGLIKDRLAPGCTGNDFDDKTSSSPACRDDADGLRLTMLIISLWLIWSVVLFGASYFFVLSRPQMVRHLLVPSSLRVTNKKHGVDDFDINDITENLIVPSTENDDDKGVDCDTHLQGNFFHRKSSKEKL